MSNSALTDAVGTAISALEAIRIAAGEHDRDLAEARRRATKAEKQAACDRRERQEAVGKVAGLEAKIIETRAAVAGEVETLRAEKEMLATRDREAREELSRLQLSELQRLGHGKQIKPRGVTAG